ncbi:MAG: hypothetical protein UW68_C0046G0014, partial [Candidatus Collierbacteria bacterium GW2011_GWB1_44_6]
ITMTVNLTNTYPEGSRIGRYLGYLDTTNNKFQRLLAPDLGTGADGAFTSAGPTTTWSTDKNFTSVTIQNGHTVYVQGNIALKCQGHWDLQQGGKISAKGQGHAGGTGGRYTDNRQGYSYAGTPGWGQGNNYGGGGCGDGSGSSASRGGGAGGGYGTAGTPGNGNETPTVGGQPYNDAGLSYFTTIYLYGSGGGGGGGASNYSILGNGGAGGGIIRIHAKTCTIAGEVDDNGNDGVTPDFADANYKGAGGGGSGGTIFFQVIGKFYVTATGNVHSLGGAGGLGRSSSGYDTYGNGGAGGAGRIRIEAGKIVNSGTISPTYATGYANNMGAYARYGWYTTAKVKPLNKTFFANAHIKFYANVAVAPSGVVSSGQKVVGLSSPNALLFNSGMRVIIYENEKMDIGTINTVGGTSITLVDNLVNSYTTGATVIRVDARAYGSLVATGANENFQELDLKEVANLGSSIWQLEYAKSYQLIGSETDKLQFCGRVRLEGKDNDTVDVNAKDISWSYF